MRRLLILSFVFFFSYIGVALAQAQPGMDPKCLIKEPRTGKYINEGKECTVEGSAGQCAKGKCTITGAGKGDGQMPQLPKMPEKGGEKGGGQPQQPEQPQQPQQPAITTNMDPCASQSVSSAFGDSSGTSCAGAATPAPETTAPATASTSTATTTAKTSIYKMIISNFQSIFAPSTTTNDFWNRNRTFQQQQYDLRADQTSGVQTGGASSTSPYATTGGFVNPANSGGQSFSGGFNGQNSWYMLLNNAGQIVNSVWNGVSRLMR